MIIIELFKLSPEDLSEICIKAEFDENNQLIIDEENCVRKGNIIFFKKPIYIKFGVLQTSILGYTAIVKEDADFTFLFLFAVAETEKYRDTLESFYDANHCDRYDCFGLDGYCTDYNQPDYVEISSVFPL